MSPRSPQSSSVRRKTIGKKDSNLAIPALNIGTEFSNPYDALPSDRQAMQREYLMIQPFHLDPVNLDEYQKMVEKILQIPMIVFELTRNLSALPLILPEMIESGLIWKAIQHMFFSLAAESKNFESFIN